MSMRHLRSEHHEGAMCGVRTGTVVDIPQEANCARCWEAQQLSLAQVSKNDPKDPPRYGHLPYCSKCGFNRGGHQGGCPRTGKRYDVDVNGRPLRGAA